jgi:hypothetical protein
MKNSKCTPEETYLQYDSLPQTQKIRKIIIQTCHEGSNFSALLQHTEYSTTNHGDNDGKLLSIQRQSELEAPEYCQRISKFTVCGASLNGTEQCFSLCAGNAGET